MVNVIAIGSESEIETLSYEILATSSLKLFSSP